MFGGIDPRRPNIQIEVRTADEVLTLSSTAGTVEVRTGPAPSPDVVVTGRPELIVGLMSGALDKDVAMSQGVSILGDFADVERLRRDDWLTPPTEDLIRHRRRPRPRATSVRAALRFPLRMVERTHSMTEPTLASSDRLVETPNGTLFVREIPGDDPPIILMHGFPDDHNIYEKLLPLLSPRRAVAFDWHGYGRSERSELGGFSLKEHACELEALLDQLDIGRAILVGHDASGPDAVAFTVAHPQRVAHLVLLNTMFGHLPSLELPEMIRLLADPDLIPLADAMINDDAERLWLLQFTADHWGMDALDPQGVAVQSVSRSSSAAPISPTPSQPFAPGQQLCSILSTSRTSSSRAAHSLTWRSLSRSSLVKRIAT